MKQPHENKALPPCSDGTRDALEDARRLTDADGIHDYDAQDGARRRERAKADQGRLSSMLQRQQSKGRFSRKKRTARGEGDAPA